LGGNAEIEPAVPVRVQLAARLGRSWHTHFIDRGRQRDVPPPAGRGVRQDQRHRAAGAHRGLQGLLADEPLDGGASLGQRGRIDQAVPTAST
jgi:hypothetical protein